MPIELELPVGRIVWGNPGKAQQKRDQNTKQVIMKEGKPVEQWAFGLAIPANDFVQRVWPAMEQEAKSGFPQGFPPNFSFKYKDGTQGVDRSGKPYNQREGYNGHYVLTIATEAFAPPIFRHDGRQYVQMAPNEIKCGDFVAVKIQMQVNVPANKSHTPGLYINPRGILFVAYGAEIISATADPTQIFGNAPQQYQLPPGASLTPLAPPVNTGMPGMPQGGPSYQPGPGPQMQPQPGYAPQGGPISTGPQTMPGQGYPPQMQPAPGPGPQYQPQQQPGPGPQYQQQPGPGPQMQPAYDFTRPGGAPQTMPGYPPNPGPGPQQQPGYGPQGQPQYQQPGPGGYPPR